MAVFYAVFVPCLAQRSLGQGVEFWDAMTNVIVYEGFLTHLKISFFFSPACKVYSKRILIRAWSQLLEVWPKANGETLVLWEKGWEAMAQGKGVDHPGRTDPGRGKSEVLDNYASSGEKW